MQNKNENTMEVIDIAEESLSLKIKRLGGRIFISADFYKEVEKSAACFLYKKLVEILASYGAVAVHVRVFGSKSIEKIWLGQSDSRERLNRCVTFIEGMPCNSGQLAGAEIEAVIIENPEDYPVDIPGKNCEIAGCRFRTGGINYLILQNLHSDNCLQTREKQTEEILKYSDYLLNLEGIGFQNVLRTWFYLDKILEWYPKFNDVRNNFFEKKEMSYKEKSSILLPASTGICGRNFNGSACTLDLIAVISGADSPVFVRRISNPRQKEAFRYGAAFSRASVAETPEFSELQLSGTAAIDESGSSLFPGDAEAQIRRTLDIVQELLQSSGFDFSDLASGTAFFKRAEYLPLFQNVLKEKKLEALPLVKCKADVCRGDLLFEIDGIAYKIKNRPEA